MYEISLTGLEFFAYHGVYDIEKKDGNRFLIDIAAEVDQDVLENTGDNLENVVDYVRLYNIVSQIMNRPVNLLETIALDIIRDVRQVSDKIISVQVTVSKLNPPVGGACKESRVTIRR
jgi:dihydroneopterin aldolase